MSLAATYLTPTTLCMHLYTMRIANLIMVIGKGSTGSLDERSLVNSGQSQKVRWEQCTHNILEASFSWTHAYRVSVYVILSETSPCPWVSVYAYSSMLYACILHFPALSAWVLLHLTSMPAGRCLPIMACGSRVFQTAASALPFPSLLTAREVLLFTSCHVEAIATGKGADDGPFLHTILPVLVTGAQ